MVEKAYGQLSNEIAQQIERLQGVELQAQSIRQEIARLLSQRSAIESELGLSSRLIGTNRRTPQTTATRTASAQIRSFWKDHAEELGVEFRASGPIPERVRKAHAARS